MLQTSCKKIYLTSYNLFDIILLEVKLWKAKRQKTENECQPEKTE